MFMKIIRLVVAATLIGCAPASSLDNPNPPVATATSGNERAATSAPAPTTSAGSIGNCDPMPTEPIAAGACIEQLRRRYQEQLQGNQELLEELRRLRSGGAPTAPAPAPTPRAPDASAAPAPPQATPAQLAAALQSLHGNAVVGGGAPGLMGGVMPGVNVGPGLVGGTPGGYAGAVPIPVNGILTPIAPINAPPPVNAVGGDQPFVLIGHYSSNVDGQDRSRDIAFFVNGQNICPTVNTGMLPTMVTTEQGQQLCVFPGQPFDTGTTIALNVRRYGSVTVSARSYRVVSVGSGNRAQWMGDMSSRVVHTGDAPLLINDHVFGRPR